MNSVSRSRRAVIAMLLTVALLPPALAAPVMHATRGIVKWIAKGEMVLSRQQNRGDITITLTPDTRIDGAIAVGATVSVRYREDGGRHVAVAVAAEARGINRN